MVVEAFPADVGGRVSGMESRRADCHAGDVAQMRVERIGDATKQPDMFVERSSPPKQEALL